jgi:hypothetical protein
LQINSKMPIILVLLTLLVYWECKSELQNVLDTMLVASVDTFHEKVALINHLSYWLILTLGRQIKNIEGIDKEILSSTLCKLLNSGTVFKIGDCSSCTLVMCASELTNSVQYLPPSLSAWNDVCQC